MSLQTVVRVFALGSALFTTTACTTAPKTDMAMPEPMQEKMASADIVDTAIAAGDFSTLVAAVQATDLVDTLKGDGPFTVFAPTDAAFANLPDGTVETLLKPENLAQLQNILTYHVVAGKVMSGDLAGKVMQTTAVNGQSLNINAVSGVSINDASVVSADIDASNGVIHVIDTVLLPE